MITHFLLRRVSPFPRVKLRVGRRNGACGNPKNRVKRRHRIEPTIETEHVFVEVGLQVLWLDTAMMRSLDPSFQVAENEMDHGQMRLGFVGVAAERQRLMVVSHFWKARVASPAIGAEDGAARNVVFNEAGKRIGAAVGHDTKSQTSCIDAALVLLAVVSARPNLYRPDDKSLVMDAATFAACLAADHAFVNFDRMLAANGIALWANHASAELVKYLKGSLITREPKLTLELNGALAGGLRGHQVRAPKPCRERRMARLHDGSGRQRCIGFASTTSQHDRRARSETVRLSYKPALWTRKSLRPANGFKVTSASRIVRENPLKLRKRSGEAANVHGCDNGTALSLCQATGYASVGDILRPRYRTCSLKVDPRHSIAHDECPLLRNRAVSPSFNERPLFARDRPKPPVCFQPGMAIVGPRAATALGPLRGRKPPKATQVVIVLEGRIADNARDGS
jgi:hypothetical protein